MICIDMHRCILVKQFWRTDSWRSKKERLEYKNPINVTGNLTFLRINFHSFLQKSIFQKCLLRMHSSYKLTKKKNISCIYHYTIINIIIDRYRSFQRRGSERFPVPKKKKRSHVSKEETCILSATHLFTKNSIRSTGQKKINTPHP